MSQATPAAAGPVSISPSELRSSASAYEARGTGAASSALGSLAGAKSFSLPPNISSLQHSIESLLRSLDEAPQLLGQMSEAFAARAMLTAQGYESTEEHNTRLAQSLNTEQA